MFKDSLRIPIQFLSLVILQLIHSTEEYLTQLYNWFPVVTGRLHSVTGILPIITMSSQTFAVINLVAAIILIIVSIYVFRQKHWAYRIAVVVSIIEIINGVIHISAAIYTGGYFPGSISAVGLLIVAALLLWSIKTSNLFQKKQAA
jgi:hypothetical protein